LETKWLDIKNGLHLQKGRIVCRDSIHAVANKYGDFTYMEFNKIEKVNDTTYNVWFGTSWVKSDSSKVMYLSGGYGMYKFIKVNGEWKKELIGNVIS
jgi:hypothetical protein